jgi:ABC-type dipeptide/oligopeptide/nickel transport system permease component
VGAYTARRLLLLIPVVWGTLTILFLLFFVVPGDPVDLIAGSGGSRAVAPQVRENIEADYGLDKPLGEQYVAYFQRLARGDLGDSYANGRPVNDILAETLPASIRLAIWALVAETVIGISVGVLAAVRRYSVGDHVTTVVTAVVSAIPVFVLGFMLQNAFGIYPNTHGWPEWARLPVQGIGPDSWALFIIPTGDQWKYLLLPVVVLASVSTVLVARLTRTTMLEVIRADYIRTARAKGLSEKRVIYKHGLRAALTPVVTMFGLDLATLLGGAFITETVFNLPGIGQYAVRSIFTNDFPSVMGVTLFGAFFIALANLCVDIAYAFLDPRVRYT